MSRMHQDIIHIRRIKHIRITMKRLLFFMLLAAISGCKKDDPDTPAPDQDFVYFLVEERVEEYNDSYVLALKDPAQIAEARAIIAGTSDPKIVLAEITTDAQVNYYVNRDLNKDRAWSWHVAAFLGFYDQTIEIYDGWPEYVEANYSDWVENTKSESGNGVIGFWNYTVTREVALEELE